MQKEVTPSQIEAARKFAKLAPAGQQVEWDAGTAWEPVALSFECYQNHAVKTAIYPKEHGIWYTALGLAGEAGEVANKAKKILRDDGSFLTEERRQQLAKEIGGVLWYCAALAEELDLNLGEVAALNLAELASRKARGTLKGSGDNR